MAHLQRLSSADMRVFRSTARLHGSLFSLSVAPLATGPRFACVVSKKIAPLAVSRNRIKRLCREALRKEAAGSRDERAFVFHAKGGAQSATLAAVLNDIRALLSRAGFRATIPRT